MVVKLPHFEVVSSRTIAAEESNITGFCASCASQALEGMRRGDLCKSVVQWLAQGHHPRILTDILDVESKPTISVKLITLEVDSTGAWKRPLVDPYVAPPTEAWALPKISSQIFLKL